MGPYVRVFWGGPGMCKGEWGGVLGAVHVAGVAVWRVGTGVSRDTAMCVPTRTLVVA